MVKTRPTRSLKWVEIENLRFESLRNPHDKQMNIRVTSQCLQRLQRIKNLLARSVFSNSELIEMALISLEEDLLVSELSVH
jgi:hypothetical protein